MATVLRLARQRRKHRRFYHVVAANSRDPLNGSHIEKIGYYDALTGAEPTIDAEKALKWLSVGAKPSDTVKALLRRCKIGQAAPAAPAAADQGA